jgi:hypothetical protein
VFLTKTANAGLIQNHTLPFSSEKNDSMGGWPTFRSIPLALPPCSKKEQVGRVSKGQIPPPIRMAGGTLAADFGFARHTFKSLFGARKVVKSLSFYPWFV